MDRLFIVALFALAWIQKINGVEQFVFHGPTIAMVEVPGISMEYQIDITRTSNIAAELEVANTITLTSNCPAGVTPTASSSDYSVKLSGATTPAALPLQVEFLANINQMTVIVTINDDSTYESTEIFCMSIQPESIAGSQDTITVSIPENDFCYTKSIQGHASSYAVTDAIYVGPWTPSISNTVDITVTPQTGESIIIYLAEDTAPTGMNFYSIVFDDKAAATHKTAAMAGAAGVDGETLLFHGDPADPPVATLIGDNSNAGVITDATPYSFWLRYIQSSGTIQIGAPGTRDSALHEYTHSTLNPKLVIKHIFVNSVHVSDSASTFEICHPASPKKITPVGATSKIDSANGNALGYQSGGSPSNAIDGNVVTTFFDGTCFVSDNLVDPWLRIDLGQQYDVTYILIWPVDDQSTFNAIITPANLEGLEVKVGSCPSVDSAGNKLCFPAITTAMAALDPIEGGCTANTYGQYVFISKPSTGGAQVGFSLCEVEVFGRAVPFGDDASVQFTMEEFEASEATGTMKLTVQRTGQALSCTTAEYYTDTTVTPITGDSNDFVAQPNDPMTASTRQLTWDETDTDPTTKEITVTINADDICEPYETFMVYLNNVQGGITGQQSWARVKILDDDSLTFSLSANMYPVMEGQVLSIPVVRSGAGTNQVASADLTFSHVGGSATTDDYVQEASPQRVNFLPSSIGDQVPGSVTITEDQIYEGTVGETFTVNLGNLMPNDGCSMLGSMTGSNFGTATITITDNDSRFYFDVDTDTTTIRIQEGQSESIKIMRDGTTLQKNVDVIINEGGTADLVNDFTITPAPDASRVSTIGFITGADAGTQELTINTVNDSDLEDVETFTLTLRDPLYPQGNRKEPYSLTISIYNNDAEYFWKQNSYSVTEGGALQVCLIRTGEPDVKTIVITTSGTAVAGSDFTAIPQIEFATGLYEACANLQTADDTVPEQTKTIMMQISSGQDIVTNTLTDKTSVSIVDDDTVISFSQPTYTFMEGQSGLSVMISKTGNPSVSFTLTITSRTATQNNDFILNVGSSSSLTIPTGTTSLTLPITIINDGLVEQAEQFIMTISSPSGGTISTPTATITITDNDVAIPIPPVTPITTPTTTADSAIGGAAIAAIVVSISIGVIIIIIAIVIFCVMLSGASAAASATAGASATAAANSFPLTNYPSGYNNAINGLDSGFGGTRTSYNPYYM